MVCWTIGICINYAYERFFRMITSVTPKITVVSGKGNKDRVVPIGESLKEELYELTQNKEPNDSVFGLNHRSLGMKIKEWSSKAKCTNSYS